MKKRILVVGDDMDICRVIQRGLQDATTDVSIALSVAERLDIYMRQEFCLAILDTPLLDTDALRLIRTLRCAKPVPILVLYFPAGPLDKTTLLQSGASACVEKPLDLLGCIEQARALIHLYTAKGAAGWPYTLTFGMDLVIDPSYRLVILKGERLELTKKEFDLLYFLASHNRQGFTLEQIYNRVWNEDSETWGNEAVRFCIKSLRRKLAVDGQEYIQNVRGVGYRFTAGANWA